MIIVTGQEGSGSTYISIAIAHAMGIEYDGRAKVGPIVHHSIPCGVHGGEKGARNFDILKYSGNTFVVCIRDNNCSIYSKHRRFRRGITLDCDIEDNEKARDIITKIITTERSFVFSYETFMYLRGPYLQQLYKFLDIKSDYVPTIIDGNEKYLQPERPKIAIAID
jgi:hypothetical protein